MTDPRTPTSDPVAALDAAWEALIADAVGSFNPSSVIRRHRPIIEAEARQQARAAFAADVEHAYAEGYLAGQAHAEHLMREARAAFAAQVAAAVERLAGQCHSRSGLMCDDHPCSTNVSRAAVLRLLAASPEPASPEASGSGLREAEHRHIYTCYAAGHIHPVCGFRGSETWLAARPDGAEADAS